MRLVRAGALVAAVAALVVAAYVGWYVYGAWPVPDGYEFPRHSLWGGAPTALFEGSLVERHGCVRLPDSTIVWPPGYSLGLVNGEPVVRGGGRVVHMGAQVRLGGGGYSREDLSAVAQGAARTRCPEPFILTTGLVD